MPTSWVTARLLAVRDWWRAYDPVVWDRWFAIVMTVLAFVPPLATMSAEFGDLPARPANAFSFVLVLAQTLPLAVRSRWPVACLAVVSAAFALYEGFGFPPEFGTVTLYFAIYSVGAHQQRFRRTIALIASAAYLGYAITADLLGSPDRPLDFLIFFLIFVAFWSLGAFVRARRAEEVERRRVAAIAATTAERARIARELHDVVTHHVTAIVVQADATQFLAESPDRVVTALTTIGGTGRRALTELRYLLDVLEATGESAGKPTPVEGTVRELVEQTRAGGQPIELTEDGDQPELPVGVGLAVYRVVQEGLTNAVKYAAGQPTEVRIGYRDGEVAVEVLNCAAPVPLSVGTRKALSGGRGLTGLRDRVETLGGELSAGEQPDGRFLVHALIPFVGKN